MDIEHADNAPNPEPGTDPGNEPAGNRRELFTKAGAAAAVAAVAGLALSERTHAANGDPLTIGQNNSGTLQTSLTGGSTISVFNGTSASASLYGSQTVDGRYGVRGFNSGSSGAGVYGTNSGSNGYGVRGANTESGGFGVYGENSAVGTDSAGVRGRNTGSGHGVWGLTSDGTGAGVYGNHVDAGIGVYGHHSSSSQSGTGVLGTASIGSGVVGRGSTFDVLADRSGKVGLSKVGTTGATAVGTVGTIARAADGHLWYCYATDKWEQLSGIVSPGAPPSFTAITPIRAYDSRIVAIPQSGAFAANSDKVISIKDGRDQVTGAIDAPDAIPGGVTAVAFNVTATNTTAGSFLAVVPGNITSSAVSSLNWSGPGISIANAGIVGVDGSRQVRIIAGPVGTFDAIVDITGYFS